METQTTTQITPRKRKSVVLSKDDHKAFKDYCKGFNTATEAAEAIGMDQASMKRILLVGSGSPENIEKIKSAIEGTK